MKSLFRLAPVLFLALLPVLVSGLARAQEAGPKRPLDVQVKEWTLLLERSDKQVSKGNGYDERLEAMHDELADLRLEAQAAIVAAAPDAQVLRDEMNTLGAPPAEGAPPESPAVAGRRKATSERLATIEGAIKQAELIIAHADRLLEEINARERARFTEEILTRGQSPLSPSVWKKVVPELAADLAIARQDIGSWLGTEEFARQGRQMGRNLTLAVLTAYILVWPLRRWLLRRFGYVTLEGEPTHGQRLRVALFTGFIRILMPTAATLAVYLGMKHSGLLPEKAQVLADAIFSALVFLFAVSAFCRAALAPDEPHWRLVHTGDYGATVITHVVSAVALVFALDQIFDELRIQFDASLELTVVHKFISGLLISGLLLLLLRPKIWSGGTEREQPARLWRRLRVLLRVLVLAIPLSAVLGYVAMSRLLATQLVLTAGLYVAVVLLREICAETVDHMLSAETEVGQRLRESLNLSDESSEILRFWLTESAGVLILLFGLLALLMLWGAGGDDLAAWLHSAFFGFKVGSITLSLADLLMALLLFTVLLTVTRLLQRALEHRIFPRTRLDPGVRHSIRSSIGYLGFTLALTVAVSTVGIDLSNLAMIAGALSVGIGFGLQNVVNNFVSGLILLVERPIKVGDWVVVGEHQGYVKKISVRATEITTFDRASVFIPNSSLISTPVMNRTYADKVGRVVLTVGAAYGEDTKRLRDILLDIVCRHPDVAHNPAPAVFLKDFGDSSLQLELVAFIHDVDRVKAVASDLRFDIDETFRLRGMQMPHPQRDMHIEFKDDQLLRLAQAMAGKVSASAPAVPAVGRSMAE